MDTSKIDKAHFVGIGGIGISAIARLFHANGIKISGSDLHLPPPGSLPEGEYFPFHSADNITLESSMLVYSDAVPQDNPERIFARANNIPEKSYAEILGLTTLPYETIAISGTHGKSTTTAIAASLFIAGGFDPSAIVGAVVPNWKSNLRIGKSSLFIVEADEYMRHMMQLEPQTIVLTNLELDHPDYYVDLADVKQAFRDYLAKLAGEDLIVLNNDDANLRDITKDSDNIVVRYGIGEGADLVARNIHHDGDKCFFDLTWQGTDLGTFETWLPGIYNIYNILAATATYLAYSGQSEFIQPVLDQFTGVGRRFEILGSLEDTVIIADYAHHPTALKAVSEAAQLRYPGKEILIVFRPHQRARTRKLFNEFVDGLGSIPHVLLLEIYDVPGREEGEAVSSVDLISKTKEKYPNADIGYASSLDEASKIVREAHKHFDVILVVGAGDTDKLAHELISKE